MNDYVIFADSACDIPEETLREWGVREVIAFLNFDGDEQSYRDNQLPVREFYQRMRDGGVARTAAINAGIFHDAFEPALQEGLDILYVAFSSGLSNTGGNAKIAADELLEQYPERKIVVVDSLAASAGYGLMVYLTARRKAEGDTLEQVAKYVEDTRLHVCHWFTVDDLVYLKRGGRVSAATALVGGVLGIKPVLHVDNDGHLINILKVRGRKASLRTIADKYGELALTPGEGTVFISHGDCEDDALQLRDMIRERYGVETDRVVFIGPLIGAHSGPGTLALFFLGKER